MPAEGALRPKQHRALTIPLPVPLGCGGAWGCRGGSRGPGHWHAWGCPMNRPCRAKHVAEPRPPKEQANGRLEGWAQVQTVPAQRAPQGVWALETDVARYDSAPRLRRQNSGAGGSRSSTPGLHPPPLPPDGSQPMVVRAQGLGSLPAHGPHVSGARTHVSLRAAVLAYC